MDCLVFEKFCQLHGVSLMQKKRETKDHQSFLRLTKTMSNKHSISNADPENPEYNFSGLDTASYLVKDERRKSTNPKMATQDFQKNEGHIGGYESVNIINVN